MIIPFLLSLSWSPLIAGVVAMVINGQLIILEVAGLLKSLSSSLAWRVCLGLMVVSLHVLLPLLLAYACLGEIGLGR